MENINLIIEQYKLKGPKFRIYDYYARMVKIE